MRMNSRASSIPISIRGRHLWRGDDRFFVRGVAYQDHCTFDPILDDHLPQLEQDVLLFKELGLNTIFVYSIDNTRTHDRAMKLLEEAGIYVLTTVSTPTNAIHRMDPYDSYNSATLISFFKTIDTMASYPNSLGILAAYELVNNDATTSSTPVIKAVVRDIKKHMKLRNEATGQRVLPIGYGGSTSRTRDQMVLEYLSCGDDRASLIDFWTCKNFSWEGDSNMARSGYNDLIDQLRPTTIPIFLSEYGAQTQQPRLFTETRALYSAPMAHVFSGGCVYEFWQASNAYGLVEMLGEGGNPASSAYQAAQARARDPRKVYERREVEGGALLVYHDFVNYKESLAATRDVEARGDGGGAEYGMVEKRVVQTSWPWEPEFQVPECCVDWEELRSEHID